MKRLNDLKHTIFDKSRFKCLYLCSSPLVRVNVFWPIDNQHYGGVAHVQNTTARVYYDDGEVREYTVSELINRGCQFSKTILNTPPARPLRRGFGLKGRKCSICLEKIECPAEIVRCGHIFCGPCLQNSLWSNNQNCPICRGAIETIKLMSYADTKKLADKMASLEKSRQNEQIKLNLISQRRQQIQAKLLASKLKLKRLETHVHKQRQKLKQHQQELATIDQERLEHERAGQKARQKIRLSMMIKKLKLIF